MRENLEQMCFLIDEVLANHDLTAKVVGGYLSPRGCLLSLDDATFVNTLVRREIQHRLQAQAVAATIGTILVRDWLKPQPIVIEGICEVVEPEPAVPPPVETVDLLDLMRWHSHGRIRS